MPLDPNLQVKADKLGKLLATSLMPAPLVEAISKEVPNLTIRQVDLLIDGLEREQQEWQRLDKMFAEVEGAQQQSQLKLQERQTNIAKRVIAKVLEDEEANELEQARKTAQEQS
jgi:hypothetical protein